MWHHSEFYTAAQSVVGRNTVRLFFQTAHKALTFAAKQSILNIELSKVPDTMKQGEQYTSAIKYG